MDEIKRELGMWYTLSNPFNHSRIAKWLDVVRTKNLPVVEPFVGTGNLVNMIPDLNWQGLYDINPQTFGRKVHQRNSLIEFPEFSEAGQKYKAVITNPPWLSKNSAARRKIKYFEGHGYDDLYKQAIFQCLTNCEYVLAILPENFLKSGLFQERLVAVIRLTSSIFGLATEHPSCIALFDKETSVDFEVWEDEKFLGMYFHLINHPVLLLQAEKIIPFKFNSNHGEIVMHGLDKRSGPTILFTQSSEERINLAKSSDRHVCRIQIPLDLRIPDTNELICMANQILDEFRKHTFDVGLSSAKSSRRDGRIRRRLDFDIARRILTLAYSEVVFVRE